MPKTTTAPPLGDGAAGDEAVEAVEVDVAAATIHPRTSVTTRTRRLPAITTTTTLPHRVTRTRNRPSKSPATTSCPDATSTSAAVVANEAAAVKAAADAVVVAIAAVEAAATTVDVAATATLKTAVRSRLWRRTKRSWCPADRRTSPRS